MFQMFLEIARVIAREMWLYRTYVAEDPLILSLAEEHDEKSSKITSECRRAGYAPIACVVLTPTPHFTNSRLR